MIHRNVMIHIYAAPDVDGQWVAHLLDMDVVTQGDSPAHALQMGMEACTLTAASDLAEGRDPFRRRAPQEDLDAAFKVLEVGTTVATDDLLRDQGGDRRRHYVTQVTLDAHVDATTAAPPMRPIPTAWTTDCVAA